MCHTYDLTPGDELTPAEFGRLCAAMPRLSWLDVTGGELFMRRDIEEVFDAICDNSPRLGVLHFPTNGWFGTRVVALAERIRSRRPDVELIITVSLDGPQEVHDRIRGRAGSFDRAIETFVALRKLKGVSTYVGTTLTSHNEASLETLRAELHRRVEGFDDRHWHWNWLQISEHFFDNRAEVSARAPREVELCREHRHRRGLPRTPVDLMEWAFLLHLEDYLQGKRVGFDCQALHGSCFVSADGKLYPCHVYDRPLGDLREWNFDVAALWASQTVLDAREDIKQLACGGCFTPCEAYPALAGAPLSAGVRTVERALRDAVASVTRRA
jgi:radical SAM protein with 4Fe4S-binding SPASM domain